MSIYVSGGSGGSSTLTIQSITTNSSITAWGTLAEVDTSAGDVVVTLPSALGASKGQNVVIKKTTNDNNKIIIKGNSTDTIEKSTQSLYIYGYNDAVTLTNTINNSSLISDCRNSTGSSGSFARFTRTASQTSVIAGTDVIFTDADTNIGSGVTFNSSTGIITLKANSTFKLTGSTGSAKLTGQSAYVGFMWKKSIDGGTTWNNIGTLGCCISPSGTTWDVYGDEVATASITTTTQTLVKLSVTAIYATNTIGTMNDVVVLSSLPYCEIEEMSRASTIINTVDYISAYQSAVQNITTNNTFFNIDTKIEGNMILNADHTVSLRAGKTYLLVGSGGFANPAIADVCFKNITTNTDIQGYQGYNTAQGVTISVHYTPTSDCKVGLFAKYVYPTGNFGLSQPASNPPRQLTAWFTITQIGSTGVTNVPNTLIQPFTGATSSLNGTQGGVPIPTSGQQNSYLKGDGTWGIKIYKGTATIGDVGILYSSLPVTGDIVSGSASANSGGSVEILINHPTVSANAIYNITIENLGGQMYANDLTPLVFTRMSTSQIKVYFEETANSVQNIKLNIAIFD